MGRALKTQSPGQGLQPGPRLGRRAEVKGRVVLASLTLQPQQGASMSSSDLTELLMRLKGDVARRLLPKSKTNLWQ